MNKRTICMLSGMPLLMAGCGEREYSTGYVEPRYGHTVPESATHVEFSFRRARVGLPASGVDSPPWVLKIPKEYVHLPHVKWHGNVLEEVPLHIEIPDASAWGTKNGIGEKSGHQAGRNDQAHSRKFTVTVGAPGARSAWSMEYLPAVLPTRVERTGYYWIEGGYKWGLRQFSRVYCYNEEDSKRADIRKSFSTNATNKYAPKNCYSIDGHDLFVTSTEGMRSDSDLVTIKCPGASGACWLRFDLSGEVGAAIVVSRYDIANWDELVSAVRERLDSLVVHHY